MRFFPSGRSKPVFPPTDAFPLIGDPAEAIAREVAAWGNGGPSPSNAFLAYTGLAMGGDLDLFQLGQPINKACAGIKGAAITKATTDTLLPAPLPGDYAASDLVVDADTVLSFDSSPVRIEVTIL